MKVNLYLNLGVTYKEKTPSSLTLSISLASNCALTKRKILKNLMHLSPPPVLFNNYTSPSTDPTSPTLNLQKK